MTYRSNQLEPVSSLLLTNLSALSSASFFLVKKLFPKSLKKAVVIPIFKSGCRDVVNNYRPIIGLPSESKILTKDALVTGKQTTYFLLHNSGLEANCLQRIRCQKLTDHVSQELGDGNQVLTIFLDLAKALTSFLFLCFK